MVNKLTVVNKHALLNNNTDLHYYIGRGSLLGNPYTHLGLSDTKAEYKVANREEAIKAYRQYLIFQIKERNPAILKGLKAIQTLLSAGNVSLVCFCKPAACHGDIIKALIENQNNPK